MVSLRSEGRREAPRLLFCLWGHEEQTERQNAGGWALWGQARDLSGFW